MSNTEQSYVGKGDYATPTPQTVNSDPQPHAFQDERHYYQRLLAHPGAIEYLHLTLETVGDYCDQTDPIPLLTELTAAWLNQPWTAREERISDKTRHLLNLIRFLSELRTFHTVFQMEVENALQEAEPDQQQTGEGEAHE